MNLRSTTFAFNRTHRILSVNKQQAGQPVVFSSGIQTEKTETHTVRQWTTY
ncbi:hypothetical protein AHF37_02934 [Paragonimus kellicotti]|nr:hypothetical protein AHF37_02934 [Paragonimus kellicotti]